MQNMEHINAADSGQCQAFLHCVKLNKQDQAKANGNWPSRDKAVATEARGHRNLKPSSNLCGLSEKKKEIYSPLIDQMFTLLYIAVEFLQVSYYGKNPCIIYFPCTMLHLK